LKQCKTKTAVLHDGKTAVLKGKNVFGSLYLLSFVFYENRIFLCLYIRRLMLPDFLQSG